ncbi:hypothetical protein [Spirosoma endophyticum]|uniref:DUF1778 domain-containing protein n=1 Tax=Spirosoma endophyticum TaxID=662367 RepID=A0A1I2BDL3_9BACT|nr:hypothetical protein [Spirosoma endophyticum]SFE54139.1 hypothetical protein SAMN05216167_11569 [Spirosoma endophyticum]
MDQAPDLDPQTTGQTETQKSPTAPTAAKSTEPAKWTIRGIEPETHLVIEKAATRSGKTLGQFFNAELREAATNVLKKGNQPPACPEDLVGDLVEKLKAELQASQATELQSIREAIERRPASLREWLFGKR